MLGGWLRRNDSAAARRELQLLLASTMRCVCRQSTGVQRLRPARIGRDRMRPFTDLDSQRCQAATVAVDSIRTKLAAGARFRVAVAGEIYVTVRDNLKLYRSRTFVSPDQLRSLQRADKGMRGKKK